MTCQLCIICSLGISAGSCKRHKPFPRVFAIAQIKACLCFSVHRQGRDSKEEALRWRATVGYAAISWMEVNIAEEQSFT